MENHGSVQTSPSVTEQVISGIKISSTTQPHPNPWCAEENFISSTFAYPPILFLQSANVITDSQLQALAPSCLDLGNNNSHDQTISLEHLWYKEMEEIKSGDESESTINWTEFYNISF